MELYCFADNVTVVIHFFLSVGSDTMVTNKYNILVEIDHNNSALVNMPQASHQADTDEQTMIAVLVIVIDFSWIEVEKQKLSRAKVSKQFLVSRSVSYTEGLKRYKN